ncbi:hypothetical protein [Dactylosporangium sp. NPDC050588]|uniref:hypothetical protein n=1 Tax=Dactylosporangium sp. NPDC050588 TaxID=3157211 RepID=UPI0034082CE7
MTPPGQSRARRGSARWWRGAGGGAARLVWLHVVGRRVPAALAVILACAAGLRVALLWQWKDYGALQLPLLFETGCAAAIAVAAAGPFGEPERATGGRLPWLRLGTALALTAVAAGALLAAGGTLRGVRDLAGLVGVGLLCAVLLGGAPAWAGPLGYAMAGVYALYTQWHAPALTTPWIWPGRPAGDVGGAVCAALVFAAGTALFTWRGARDVST